MRRKKGGRIFQIFSLKGQSEFLVARRVRWDERQRVLVTQEEESRRRAQEVDYEVCQKLDSSLPIGCKKNVELFGQK